jgi:quinol-cytochrome oxidoreductase complex cytochrome b subunit
MIISNIQTDLSIFPSPLIEYNFAVQMRLWLILLLLGILLAVIAPTATLAAPPDDEPAPGPLRIDPRMNKPVIPENPTRADRGALFYWEYCLACHGDKGQGLTDEFREMAYREDKNCWQSKCHASNHPIPGFVFPRSVPPVMGNGTLMRFITAEDLYQYIYRTMPWYKHDMPIEFSDDDYWNITAYLLHLNGVLPNEIELEVQAASLVPVHLPARSRVEDKIVQFILVGSLSLATIGILVGNRWRTSSEPAGRPGFIDHLHPPTIPLPQARWRYTLGAGGLASFLLLIIIATGILEMFYYIPTPEAAGRSIQTITYAVPYGGLVRGLHFWAAQGLVIVALIHLLRVVFTGAYTRQRRLNYLLGIFLFVLALLLDFTGYVLRWDEGIRWALTVGTNLIKTIPLVGTQLYNFLVGGEQPGAPTLIRFYAWHLFGLMAILTGIFIWHIFRVRRDGGISAPPPDARADTRRITRFELVRREILAALLAIIGLVLLAIILPTPIGVPIQDVGTAQLADAQAPWFFLWVQQLLRFGDAFWLGVALPLSMLALLTALPYLFPNVPEEQQGRWFPRSGRSAQVFAALLIIAWIALTVMELLQ